MSKPLTPEARQALKGRAHRLHPVVMIGNEGLSDAVIREIDASLKAHELIKVRVGGDDREARAALLDAICERTGASPVQQIGKILVIYRERPPEAAPEPVAAPARKPPPSRRPVKEPRAARAPSGAAAPLADPRPGRSPRLLPRRGRPTRSGRR